MKKVLSAVFVFVLLFPTLSFAATDDQIKSSLTQQLLSMFVVEVNSLDAIQGLVAQSSNPSQFDNFSALVSNQLSQTTSQLATLLDAPASATPIVPPPTVIQSTPQAPVAPVLPINNKSMVTYSGWDGSKVVIVGSTLITVTDSNGNPVAHTPIFITEMTYGHQVVNSETDANGQYIFRVSQDAGTGTQNLKISIPSINYSQVVNMIVTNPGFQTCVGLVCNDPAVDPLASSTPQN